MLYIMPHYLEILCDTIDMWSFQFRCWSSIMPKNFDLVTLCIASLRKMTSPWGFRVFFLDIINIWVLFKLSVRLLESNHSATLANSELRILIGPSMNHVEHILWCHQQRERKTRYYCKLIISLMDQNNKGPRMEPYGTPMFTLSKGEGVWFQETKCSRSDR